MEKAVGITRRLDELGRIVIPMEIRKNLNIEIREPYGLSGLGDLIVTCLSEHSRNRKAGKLIGQGKTLEETYKYCPHCGKEQIWYE